MRCKGTIFFANMQLFRFFFKKQVYSQSDCTLANIILSPSFLNASTEGISKGYRRNELDYFHPKWLTTPVL